MELLEGRVLEDEKEVWGSRVQDRDINEAPPTAEVSSPGCQSGCAL